MYPMQEINVPDNQSLWHPPVPGDETKDTSTGFWLAARVHRHNAGSYSPERRSARCLPDQPPPTRNNPPPGIKFLRTWRRDRSRIGDLTRAPQDAENKPSTHPREWPPRAMSLQPCGLCPRARCRMDPHLPMCAAGWSQPATGRRGWSSLSMNPL